MFEWLFHRRLSALGLFNLPLDTQKVVIYLGGAYTFRRDTVALLYGIGHRF